MTTSVSTANGTAGAARVDVLPALVLLLLLLLLLLLELAEPGSAG